MVRLPLEDEMMHVRSILLLAVLAGVSITLTSCKDAADDKQPKFQGTVDPKIKGPAQPGGGGQPKASEI